jgi:hypothetical protein
MPRSPSHSSSWGGISADPWYRPAAEQRAADGIEPAISRSTSACRQAPSQGLRHEVRIVACHPDRGDI